MKGSAGRNPSLRDPPAHCVMGTIIEGTCSGFAPSEASALGDIAVEPVVEV